jgi:hypothetical protein
MCENYKRLYRLMHSALLQITLQCIGGASGLLGRIADVSFAWHSAWPEATIPPSVTNTLYHAYVMLGLDCPNPTWPDKHVIAIGA